MNIVYTSDNNFAWIMGVSMISLFENNKELPNLSVYLFADNVSNENKQLLIKIAAKYEREFQVIDVHGFKIPEKLTSARWPKCVCSRIFTGELLPKTISRVVYLDSDTIVRGRIDALETLDTQGNAICAVKDCVSRQYKRNIGIEEGNYVNSGVLLMDLDKMRQLDIRKMMADFMNEYLNVINYPDQDMINGMFKGKFGILPPKYNVMTQMCCYNYNQLRQWRRPHNYYSQKEFEYAQEHPVIIHYTTCMLNIRPWCEESKHPWASEFDKYQRLSPWSERKKGVARFDKKEHKVMKALLTLPDCLSYRMIGWIHAKIRPMMIMVRGKRKS